MSGKKRKEMVPVIVVILLIVLVGCVGALTAVIKRMTPSDERMDVRTYYGLTSDDDVALVLQNTVSDRKAKMIDGHIYLDYDTVSDVLGGRFYWDEENQKMLYSTPSEVISISPDSNTYTAGGKEKTEEYPIICEKEDTVYLALEFIEQYMQIMVTKSENPDKVIISYKFGTQKTVTVTEDTVVRYRGGIKSEILTDVKKKDKLVLLETLDEWSRVATEDGFDGYIKNDSISDAKEEKTEYQGEFNETYTSLTRDYKINLAWHQVTSEDANKALSELLSGTKGINVLSPTWFSVTGTDGAISSLASADYVKTAHEAGMEVWGLVDNFNSSVSTLATLSNTASRNHLVEMLLSEAKRVGMDGINVDFESMTKEEAPHFIQFIRELSIGCRKNSLVLSVDDPVPEFTTYYNRKEQGIVADYVIIMGYDEHTEGSEKAGSVASLPFVEKGITQTLKEVPANKVINGMPFYTRMWYTDTTGSVTSEILGMSQAGQSVENMGMTSAWDEKTSQNYAELETGSGKYQMWLEDEQSLEEKLKLFQKYELAGVAEWKLGLERNSVWDLIEQYLK